MHYLFGYRSFLLLSLYLLCFKSNQENCFSTLWWNLRSHGLKSSTVCSLKTDSKGLWIVGSGHMSLILSFWLLMGHSFQSTCLISLMPLILGSARSDPAPNTYARCWPMPMHAYTYSPMLTNCPSLIVTRRGSFVIWVSGANPHLLS